MNRITEHQVRNAVGRLRCSRLPEVVDRHVRRFTALYQASLPDRLVVFCVALNVDGGECLLAMFDDPDAVHHDMRAITDPIRQLMRWYLDGLRPDQVCYDLECPDVPWRRAIATAGKHPIVDAAPCESEHWCRELQK